MWTTISTSESAPRSFQRPSFTVPRSANGAIIPTILMLAPPTDTTDPIGFMAESSSARDHGFTGAGIIPAGDILVGDAAEEEIVAAGIAAGANGAEMAIATALAELEAGRLTAARPAPSMAAVVADLPLPEAATLLHAAGMAAAVAQVDMAAARVPADHLVAAIAADSAVAAADA